MVNVALLVRLEAKPGKESDVASFLRGGLAVVEAEPATGVADRLPAAVEGLVVERRHFIEYCPNQ